MALKDDKKAKRPYFARDGDIYFDISGKTTRWDLNGAQWIATCRTGNERPSRGAYSTSQIIAALLNDRTDKNIRSEEAPGPVAAGAITWEVRDMVKSENVYVPEESVCLPVRIIEAEFFQTVEDAKAAQDNFKRQMKNAGGDAVAVFQMTPKGDGNILCENCNSFLFELCPSQNWTGLRISVHEGCLMACPECEVTSGGM